MPDILLKDRCQNLIKYFGTRKNNLVMWKINLSRTLYNPCVYKGDASILKTGVRKQY